MGHNQESNQWQELWGRGKRSPYTLLVGMQSSATLVEISTQFLMKLRSFYDPYDPAIPSWERPQSVRQHTRRDQCAMLIGALFTVAKLWQPPRCPTIGEWTKKIWHVLSSSTWNFSSLLNFYICSHEVVRGILLGFLKFLLYIGYLLLSLILFIETSLIFLNFAGLFIYLFKETVFYFANQTILLLILLNSGLYYIFSCHL
jgi:hypothetical protein